MFFYSRFLGRLVGFNVAILNSSHKICLIIREYSKIRSKVLVSNPFDYKKEKGVWILILIGEVFEIIREERNEKMKPYLLAIGLFLLLGFWFMKLLPRVVGLFPFVIFIIVFFSIRKIYFYRKQYRIKK